MIRRLYVHNFRCLENFELSLNGASSTLLLGRNGTGKSTVGLALELLQSIGRGLSRTGDLVKPRDLPNGRLTAPVRFEVEAELENEVYVYSLALDFPSQFRELRVWEERLHVSGHPVFIRNLAEVRLASNKPNADSIFRIDWHLVALPIVQGQHAQGPLSIFKAWLSNILILRPVPSLFDGSSDGDGTEPPQIDPRAVNIGAWFTDMMATRPESYVPVHQYLAQVMPYLSAITNPIVGKNTRNLVFQFRHDRSELKLDLDQMSDGEKCFVLYSLVVAASKSYRSLVCFWDEPDNFLAPDEVGHAMMGLRRAFVDGSQLLVTSHNPEVIRRFSEDNTLFLTRRSRLEPTTYKTIKAMRKSGEYEGSFVDALLRGDLGEGAKA